MDKFKGRPAVISMHGHREAIVIQSNACHVWQAGMGAPVTAQNLADEEAVTHARREPGLIPKLGGHTAWGGRGKGVWSSNLFVTTSQLCDLCLCLPSVKQKRRMEIITD